MRSDWSAGSLVGRQAACLVSTLSGWSARCLVGRQAAWLVGTPPCRSAARQATYSVSWLPGWSADRLVGRRVACSMGVLPCVMTASITWSYSNLRKFSKFKKLNRSFRVTLVVINHIMQFFFSMSGFWTRQVKSSPEGPWTFTASNNIKKNIPGHL